MGLDLNKILHRNRVENSNETERVESSSVSFVKRTYQLLAASMIAAVAGAIIAMPYVAIVYEYKWYLFGLELFMIFFGLNMTRGNPKLNLITLFFFTFLTGVTLVPLMAMVIAKGGGMVIVNSFLMTSILFGSLSLFAINSRTDLTKNWGKLLLISLIVILVVSIINLFFLESSVFHLFLSAIFLLIFSALTIFDTQNIINGAYDSPVDAAISLYLNFLNMFTIILQFMGIAGGDDK